MTKTLTVLLVAYAAATLLHFAHNAEFLAEYPNMPAWLTRTKVYAAWLMLSALGAAGPSGRRLESRIDCRKLTGLDGGAAIEAVNACRPALA